MMQKDASKVLLLKLGGQCNLHCPHCHCMKMDFVLNEDVFQYIKETRIHRITFSGGEPLLYYDLIKEIMQRCGKEYDYKFVTNATLLTDEMVEFFNAYKTYICVSYDGENGQREACDPRYRKIAKLKNNGLSVTVYDSNLNFDDLTRDVAALQIRNGLNCHKPGNFFPNFIHQTKAAPNEQVTRDMAEAYVLQFAHRLECECIACRNGIEIWKLPLLSGVLKRWFFKRKYEHGVRCCNEKIENLTIAGDFLLCPYCDIKVGNIYRGIDYTLVDSYKPDRCRKCELWDVCKNPCIMSVSDNECYIFRTLYKHYKKLERKYNLNSNALREKALKNSYQGR